MASIYELIESNPRANRREACLAILAGTGIAATSGFVSHEMFRTPERLHRENQRAALDWGLSSSWQQEIIRRKLGIDIQQPFYADNTALTKELLGDQYIPLTDILKEDGPKYLENVWENLPDYITDKAKKLRDESVSYGEFAGEIIGEFASIAMEDYPRAALGHALIMRYAYHFLEAAYMGNRASQYFGAESPSYYVIPIQQFIHSPEKGGGLISDELGNLGIEIEIRSEGLDSYALEYLKGPFLLVAQQIGKVRVFCETIQKGPDNTLKRVSPHIKIIGAYYPDQSYEAMKKFSQFTQKLKAAGAITIGAAGNFDDQPAIGIDQLTVEGLWDARSVVLFNEAMMTSRAVGNVIETGYEQWHGTRNRGISVDTAILNKYIPKYGHGATGGAVLGYTAVNTMVRNNISPEEAIDRLYAATTPIRDLDGERIWVMNDPKRLRRILHPN